MNKKIVFWDRFFWSTVLLFIGCLVLTVATLETSFDTELVNTILGLGFVVGAIMSLVFRFGMVYNAYKLKRYGWMVSNLILGDLIVLLFYFLVFRKEFDGGE